MSSNKLNKVEISKRLTWLQHALQMSQRELAASIGVHNSTYSAWTNGVNTISLNGLFMLWQTHGVSADFILFGNPDNLPENLKTIWSVNPHA